MKRFALWLAVVSAGAGGLCGRAAADGVSHPFMLWTKEEAAAIRRRIETDPSAKRQYERMVATDGRGGSRGRDGYPAFLNLFKYGVLGDEAAGRAELNALRRWYGQRPPRSVPGNPNTGNRPYRDDHWLDGVRYDVLHDLLAEEDKTNFRATVENYMQWFRTKYGPWRRCPEQGTPRTGWLPNMQYPTVAGLHVLVAATMDRDLIKEVFEAPGGLKWWLDVYVADGAFYMEEFAKFGSPVGAQLLWCEAMERLGLPQYGWGYTGEAGVEPGRGGGGTMRRHLESLIRAAYPRIERTDRMPDYPVVVMGDAGAAFVVQGRNAAGQGGGKRWGVHTMWGQPKLGRCFWWEIGHRRFPDAGLDYFLAQMRPLGADVYLPSLYFGLGPIDPERVTPPSVESYAARERGFAMLRAEESPAYWESPRPAVALQFGMYYVHYVHDCFALLGYVAHNRHIYQRMGSMRGGYAGGDPWRDHSRGQAAAVTVDDLRIQPVDSGDNGCPNHRIRSRFTSAAKFTAVRVKPAEASGDVSQARRRAAALYPGVDAERALVLTADYLFDVFRLVSDRERTYDWHVQGSGRIAGASGEAWEDVETLPGARFASYRPAPRRRGRGLRYGPIAFRGKPAGEGAWTERLVDRHADGGTVGVRVAMLPAADTELFTFAAPGVNPTNNAVLMARRRTPTTVFAALHEPFRGGPGAWRVAAYRAIAQDDRGLAVAIRGEPGSGIDDRILLRYGDEAERPLELAGGGESFTFADYAYIRVGEERVTADGTLSALRLRVKGSPELVLNGKPAAAVVRDGILRFGPAGGGGR